MASWQPKLLSGLAKRVLAQDIYARAAQTDADYAPERIEELVKRLDSDDGKERGAAFSRLAWYGPESRPAFPYIMKLLGREDTSGEFGRIPRGGFIPAGVLLRVIKYQRFLERMGLEAIPCKRFVYSNT